MVTYLFRLVVALYFLFSATNKVFFFRLFTDHLHDFFVIPVGFATALGAGVITIELVFALSLIIIDRKWWLRGLALIIAVPFIAYNAWLAFVLNAQNCHCTYGSSGESLTGPLFSIVVLIITLVIVFWTTWGRKDTKSKDTDRLKPVPTLKNAKDKDAGGLPSSLRKASFAAPGKVDRPKPVATIRGKFTQYPAYFKAAIAVVMVFAMLSINFTLWQAHLSYDLTQLSQIPFKALNKAENAQESDINIYLNLPYGNPALATHYLSTKVRESGKTASFYVLSEMNPDRVELLSYYEVSSPVYVIDQASSLPENLEHVGIQVFSGKTRLYRTDRLAEMTAEEYDDLFVELADYFSQPEDCRNRQTAQAYIDLIDHYRIPDETVDLQLSVYLVMERQCEECDEALLAMLDSYFVETGVANLTKVYFLSELFTDDPTDIIIPPTELKNLTAPLTCNYPNKLLLITDNNGNYAMVPVQTNLMLLELWITEFLDTAGININ